MRRTPRLPFFLLAAFSLAVSTSFACDSSGGFVDTDDSGDPDDTDDTPPTDTDVIPTPPPTVQGVQIGSEGIITTCGQRTVQDSDTPSGFDVTAGDLRVLLASTDAGVLSPDVGPNVTLGFQAVAGEVVVFDGPGCPETVGVPLSLTVAADPEIIAAPIGWALVEPDGTGEFAAWDPFWAGDAQPMFDPADYDTVALRFDGLLQSSQLARSFDVGFEGCAAGVCDLEAYGTVSLD